LKRVMLCIDNGKLSSALSTNAFNLANSFGAEVVGIHGYNAQMHEGAFRVMEPTLPSEYQQEEVLQKQRSVHNELIKLGMEKISLSYLKPYEEFFQGLGVSYRMRVEEGKNYRAVGSLIRQEKGDMVVIGANGFNGNSKGYLGSVCLRVVRQNDIDTLVVKKGFNRTEKPRYVVGLDGSACALDALKSAKLFASKYNAEIHMVYVFDSHLHKDIFNTLKEAVISKEGFNFNTKEQEKMHDMFIDKGLAKVGQMILERAQLDVFAENVRAMDGFSLVGKDSVVPIETRILEGHVYKEICNYAEQIFADMIFVGRTGRHYVDGMGLGSTTENVLRYSPCDVFIKKNKEYKGWEL
ncbi:MAG: universal stress protein, partial [Candidatus Magnetoovum sp. WYHC-5]|nr:universal stress protein [Candidatus Magnetoovum sp. WYHC-5]